MHNLIKILRHAEIYHENASQKKKATQHLLSMSASATILS